MLLLLFVRFAYIQDAKCNTKHSWSTLYCIAIWGLNSVIAVRNKGVWTDMHHSMLLGSFMTELRLGGIWWRPDDWISALLPRGLDSPMTSRTNFQKWLKNNRIPLRWLLSNTVKSALNARRKKEMSIGRNETVRVFLYERSERLGSACHWEL